MTTRALWDTESLELDPPELLSNFPDSKAHRAHM